MTAEGGTEYGHAVTLARALSITGPYEVHPKNPVLSTRDFPRAPLQKCGHADLVETENGEWFMVFLTGRPLTEKGKCTLGRETAIESVVWKEDNWLYLKEGGMVPRLEVPVTPNLPITNSSSHNNQFDDFKSTELNIHFQSLRIPITEDWLSLRVRPGYLRLWGQESLSSFHYQSLIARRVQNFQIEATTCVEFSPTSFQQMAGLVCYYNTGHWFYLHLLGGDMGAIQKIYIQITACDNFQTMDVLETPIDITQIERIFLKANFSYAKLNFSFALQENEWQKIGPTLDGSILSDDYVREGSTRYRPAFTGAFVGLCCQDLTGQKRPAD